MAYAVVFTPEARRQLQSIHDWILAAASPGRALAFTDAIIGYCESFKTFPHRGTRRDDLRPGLRTIGFRKRVTIAFDVEGELITIISILYGGRSLENVLGGPLDE